MKRINSYRLPCYHPEVCRSCQCRSVWRFGTEVLISQRRAVHCYFACRNSRTLRRENAACPPCYCRCCVRRGMARANPVVVPLNCQAESSQKIHVYCHVSESCFLQQFSPWGTVTENQDTTSIPLKKFPLYRF